MGAALCIAGCAAASLASTRWAPLAVTSPRCDSQKYLQVLPDVQITPSGGDDFFTFLTKVTMKLQEVAQRNPSSIIRYLFSLGAEIGFRIDSLTTFFLILFSNNFITDLTIFAKSIARATG